MKNVMANNWCKGSVASFIILFALLLVSKGDAFAADYVSLKMYPQHVGVFTVDGEQQFVAFGVKANGSTVNITSEVSWESSDERIVTIDTNGLASIVGPYGAVTSGQVKITCSYPKQSSALAAVNYLLLTPSTYSVGGTLAGFAGGTNVVLQNNKGDDLRLGTNGGFIFKTDLENKDTYKVTVKTNPASPNQTCAVTNGTGTIANADVTNVKVNCVTTQYTVGGSVTGLPAADPENFVVLQNNAGDNLTVNDDGSFTFATAIDDGESYAVTVLTHPDTPSQTCVVTNGSGSLAGANVTNVSVACTTDEFTIGGTVSGLPAADADNFVVLQNNAGDDLTVNDDGTFTFATSLLDETGYDVSVSTHPLTPSQTCSVTNDTGTLAGANVTGVSVACTTNSFQVTGVVNGLPEGETVTLLNNGADSTPVVGTVGDPPRGFSFATLLLDETEYTVTVDVGSSTVSCTVVPDTTPTGTLNGTNGSVVINCP